MIIAQVLRVDYYWSKLRVDCAKYMKNCLNYGKCRNLLYLKLEVLHHIKYIIWIWWILLRMETTSSKWKWRAYSKSILESNQNIQSMS